MLLKFILLLEYLVLWYKIYNLWLRKSQNKHVYLSIISVFIIVGTSWKGTRLGKGTTFEKRSFGTCTKTTGTGNLSDMYTMSLAYFGVCHWSITYIQGVFLKFKITHFTALVGL